MTITNLSRRITVQDQQSPSGWGVRPGQHEGDFATRVLRAEIENTLVKYGADNIEQVVRDAIAGKYDHLRGELHPWAQTGHNRSVQDNLAALVLSKREGFTWDALAESPQAKGYYAFRNTVRFMRSWTSETDFVPEPKYLAWRNQNG